MIEPMLLNSFFKFRTHAICALLCALLTLSAMQARAATISVHDGDTFKIDSKKIRLWGIDAPELEQTCKKDDGLQPCGLKSKLLLQSLVGQGDEIKCYPVETDRYKRIVAKCSVGGADLGSMMVIAGYAADYVDYSNGYYQSEQKEAQKAKRGIWATDFQMPWNYRRIKKPGH